MTNKKEKVGNAFCHIYLIVLSLIAVFPLVWVLLCSVKSSGELTSNPTRFFPKHFTLENFTHVIQDLGFAKNIGNSLIIAIITTGIAIVISSMAAYGIVRFFPKLGSIMSKVLVATYMFPPILLAIPYSMVMAKLGLVNTRIGLIIVYLSFSVPYAVWMLVGFFKTVPLGIEEAAKVDGANKFQTFIQIVLPLVMPGIVATAIYTFINAWNEFLYSLILINSTDKMTVSVALKSLQGAEILNWGDGEYNLYKNGEALTCKQYDYNFEGTSLLETPTDTDVNMNVFYKDSMFKVFPTNYLAMKYSDDEGDNWSDLNIVSTFKPEESKFLVLGPGIGKQITTGENAGRLIVPLYSKSSAELGFMYSDDHGNSWNYVEADHNTGGATAEAQIVEMPDGSLKTYLRTGSGYIAEVTSIDGGETWSDRVPLTEIATTSYGTQLSVINYSQPIDGKPAIILSAPNATNGRKNGKIWIGLINETGQSGVNKYSVEWKYCYSVDTPQMGYSYSCLTELPDGKVGLLYEKYDSWSRNELHLKNILKYEKFTIDELKVQP